MKLKRFTASNTTLAMRKIKETLGEDAVILSSHATETGVEIVAAIDYDSSVIQSNALALTSDNQQTSIVDPNTDDLIELKTEVQNLRELVENQLAGFALQNISHHTPINMTVLKRLCALGFDVNVAEKLLKALPKTTDIKQQWLTTLGHVIKNLKLATVDPIILGGTYALVGSTGVGKTTTIAKLAARYCLNYDTDSIGMIAFDNFRVGASEQLITYGKILGVNVVVATDESSLKSSVEKMKYKNLVLIDTAGFNPSDKRVSNQLNILHSISGIETILTLACTNQYDFLNQTLSKYIKSNPSSCILTKFDEAPKIGGILSALLNYSIPISYITDGQCVPEDIKKSASQLIINKMIESVDDPYIAESDIHEIYASFAGGNTYA